MTQGAALNTVITVLLLSPALDVTYLASSVVEGGITRPREVLRLPGGKGLNFARAATRMGSDVRVVAPLGGHIGAMVESLSATAGVSIVTVPIAAETRTCVTVAADDDGRLTEFYEPASELTADELAAFVVAVGELPSDGWTVLSGSIPAGLDVSVLVSILRARGPLAVDTHGAALAAIIDELRPALVKVNRREASELLGVEADALELARLVRKRSGGAVIVTDGSGGSAAVDASGQWRVSSSAPAGRFPVGSGDTFLAGIVTALDRGDPLDDALMLASTSAAANAAIPGAAEFEPAVATALRAQTTIHRL